MNDTIFYEDSNDVFDEHIIYLTENELKEVMKIQVI